MDEPTDNVTRLARIAKTMEAGHWPSSAKVVREAADEIKRQTEIIVTLRQELKDAKARNTLYLSKIQEYEVREI